MYSMEYYSAIKRNTFDSVLMRWMNLEPITLSEISQKEKDKYHILMHIYALGLQKDGTDEIICRAAREKDIENRLMDTVGREEGKCGMYGESNMETYVTICKIDSQWELLHDLENTNWGSVNTQRDGTERELGGRFKEEGTYVYLWLIHVDVWHKPTQSCKVIIP